MKDIYLSVSDLKERAKNARKDVESVDALRQRTPSLGESIFIGKKLFVWIPEDSTTDDGVTSVRPTSITETGPGRYRRATVLFPLINRQ